MAKETEKDTEFETLLGQLEVLLAKSATDDAPGESSEGSSAPTEADAAGDAPPSDPVDAAASAPTDATPGVSESQGSAAAAPEGSATHEGGEIEPAPTVEGLAAEYAKLDPEALKMHYLACKQVLMQAMGGGMDAGAGAPPAAPAAPPAPPEASGSAPAPAMKSEQATLEIVKLLKSELDQIKAEKKQTDEDLKQLADALMIPVRKSVQFMSEVKQPEAPKKKKFEELTKAEITERLIDKMKAGKLSKADGKLVSSYSFGMLEDKDVKHLLGDE